MVFHQHIGSSDTDIPSRCPVDQSHHACHRRVLLQSRHRTAQASEIACFVAFVLQSEAVSLRCPLTVPTLAGAVGLPHLSVLIRQILRPASYDFPSRDSFDCRETRTLAFSKVCASIATHRSKCFDPGDQRGASILLSAAKALS